MKSMVLSHCQSIIKFSVVCGMMIGFLSQYRLEAAEKTSAPKSNKVMLGTAELTSGIPGKGPLTEKEIKDWLGDPANHEVLEITLPLGLNAGAAQIVGLKENPLTRAKVELGRQLYFDTRLSSDNTISCASCHHPEEGFGRHTQFGIGIKDLEGGRNSPVSYNRILSGPQFWDGRAATLEEQAVGPIANPIEMGHTHEAVVKSIKEIPGYRLQFHKIFNDGVNIDNIGKAIAAFERTLVSGPSPFDYHEQLRPFLKLDKEDLEDFEAEYTAALKLAEAHPMSESAKRGRDLFFSEKVNCSACHLGPNLADEKYHNLGIGMSAKEPDLGRYEVTRKEEDKGAFKTPTIRNVEFSAPYMHDGSLETLEEVVEHYNKGGDPNPYLSDKIKKLNLTEQDKKDLVAFMKACSGPFTKVEPGRLPQ
ncbi:cytochrome c peroxidase [Gimesia sp.]|uniref:cytochrome-c peroxidase n=1 Tax=Gimesia sp. TaxID=2024833 RepID=UPI000C64DBA6|nr:cytochrome c peroxidase [Gimesia sp.]MAX39190.1 cytochrome-c peroxidase [Gimesia sp.]HAH45938.1 cytochrome-c peroxidase [Planctomycetaceae bacterium]HBL42285.1 cytochrome-c peroxidase [Planctomycetaceae bacterium]|tara:strand:+ start:9149 stop:10408 length:1260 start_codon:yes stop_codon:yes gene_type:complete